MTVEILDDNSTNPDAVLDLTGGVTSPEQEPEHGEVKEGAQEPVESAEESPASTPVEDVDAESAATEPEQEEGEETSDSEFFFNGEAVTVEVPEEVSNALEEAGVDKDALLSQLFKKDGDFSLDEETRSKLDEKFGKTLVDGYLNMYKNMNEAAIKDHAAQQEESARTLKEQQDEFMSTVGDVKGLEAIEDFVLSNFDEKQIAAYNAVMESDSHAQQLLLVQTLQKQMELSDKLANGDKNIKLVGDDSSSSGKGSVLDKGYLTNAEYLELMESDKYWEDPDYSSQVDAARIAGKRQGK